MSTVAELEQTTVQRLREGLMTLAEFEEFWREYDERLALIIQAMETVAEPRIFIKP